MSVPIYTNDTDQFVTELSIWYNTAGQSNYDEVVTVSEHMLQAANIAYDNRMNKFIVLSCLFHDIGHMIIDDIDNPINKNEPHESVGAEYLSKIFIEDVVVPVKNHVKAKRWLCTNNKRYYDKMSQASKKSFETQGSYMTQNEMAEFFNSKYFYESIKVRQSDDRAKEKNKHVNGIEFYKNYINSCLIK